METIVYGKHTPEEFWVVTKPSSAWDYEFLSNYLQISDICYRTSYRTLVAQSAGGLRPEDVLGVFLYEKEAQHFGRSVIEQHINSRGSEKNA
jgi:hypothetical protein